MIVVVVVSLRVVYKTAEIKHTLYVLLTMSQRVARLSDLWYLAAGFVLGTLLATSSHWLRKKLHQVPRYMQSRCGRRYASQCFCELEAYKCCKDCGHFVTVGTVCDHGDVDVPDLCHRSSSSI